MRPLHITPLLLLLACGWAHADFRDWPRLSGRLNAAPCRSALALAQAAHQSAAFEPATAPQLPQGEDGALVPPEGVFTLIDGVDPNDSRLYWQIQPLKDRLLIEATPFGWRGEAFTVRLLPPTLSPDAYRAATRPGGPMTLPTSIWQSWRAPLVFQEGPRQLWLIDPGQPADFLPDWQIFAVRADHFEPLCQIQFRPGVKRAAALLPRPVQRLAELLLQSLGADDEQGTYHPIAGLQIAASQAWANVALRPWALATAGYNQRAEVDAGLAAWARQSPAHRALYAEIQQQYPLAESALEVFYQRQHGMAPVLATGTARASLDAAFRAHFVFPKAR